jgi:hypothetical protein
MADEDENWHELPGGGGVQVKDGTPVQVTDRGRWDLDETEILSQAAALTRTRLTWGDLDRSKRWRRAGRARALTGSATWPWCFAIVLPAACEVCGSNAGRRWAHLPGEPSSIWICDPCRRDAEEAKL